MVSRVTAEERAEVLLRKYLTPEQLADYGRCRAFNVMGSDGHRYRVTDWTIYHVITENGTALCAYPRVYYGDLPVADRSLATKVILEQDAQSFLRVANRKPYAYLSYRPRGYPKRGFRDRVALALPYAKYGIVGTWVVASGTLVAHLSGLV